MAAAATVHTVHSGWTRNIIALAAADGADSQALWNAADLDPTELGTLIAEEAHLRVWRAIMKTLRRPGFPVHVASQRTIDDFALLGLACKTSRTVGDAVEHLIRYLSIWNTQYHCRVAVRPDSADLVLEGPTGDLARRCTNESALAQVLKAMRDVSGVAVRPMRVCFRHPAPTDTSEHEAFFGCAVEFGALFDGLELSTATLDTELVLADDGLSTFLVEQLERLAAARETDSDNLVSRVCRAICEHLPSGAPKLDEVASKLGIAPRTLQRQLSAEDATFAQLVDRSRNDLALELLRQTPLSVGEISFALGFSEPSAFHRAFKRWTGTTPSSFRSD